MQLIETIPKHLTERTQNQTNLKEATKVFLNSDTKFTDLFDSINVTIPKEKKIELELPKISSIISSIFKPKLKSGFKIVNNKIRNWKTKLHNKNKQRGSNQNDQNDQSENVDAILIKNILKECSEKPGENEEKITLQNILDEYKNIENIEPN